MRLLVDHLGLPGIFALVLAVAALVAALLHALRSSGRSLGMATVALAVDLAGGLVGTLAGLGWTFSETGSVDVAHRAEFLARGISQAMDALAIALVASVACVPFVIVGERRRKRAERARQA